MMRKFVSLRTHRADEGKIAVQEAVANDGTAWMRYWYFQEDGWGDWSQVRELPQPTKPDTGERDG